MAEQDGLASLWQESKEKIGDCSGGRANGGNRMREKVLHTEAGMEESISQASPWQMKIIIGLRATQHGLGGRV